MFKILILTSSLFFSLSHLNAKVEVRWFSVASLVLEDEETQIFFDPMFTRAGIKHWLNLAPLKSDATLVGQVIRDNHLSKIKAIFASHSHYDHVIDAPQISSLTGAPFYVDESSQRIAHAYRDLKIQTIRFKSHEKIQIGKFTIIPIPRKHSPLRLINFDWLPGPVPVDFDFGFYDYHVGDTWFYYIEHPKGKILVDQGSEPFIKEIKAYTNNVDVLIQGIANRSREEAITEGYTKELTPSVFIPTHFDNFFMDFHPEVKEISYLPRVNMSGLMEKMKETHPQIKIQIPVYGQKIELFK